MKFKDSEYGDLTGKKYKKGISITNLKITSLEGRPKEVEEQFLRQNNNLTTLKGCPEKIGWSLNLGNNNLTSLEYCAKNIGGTLYCDGNPELKNMKEQVIKYQIKATEYYSDEPYFSFEIIKEEFEKYGVFLIKKEENKLKKLQLEKINKIKSLINKNDYGLSL